LDQRLPPTGAAMREQSGTKFPYNREITANFLGWPPKTCMVSNTYAKLCGNKPGTFRSIDGNFLAGTGIDGN
jgi:hypothetical protein